MRLYCFIDIKSRDYPAVIGCLEGLREQFLDIIPVTWVIEQRDFSALPWEVYSPGELGFG